MQAAFAALLVTALAAAAAVYAVSPGPDAPAASRYYAIAAFILLALALVAMLSEPLRRRAATRRRPTTEQLLDPANRREAFRIPYPEGERPWAILRNPSGTGEGAGLEVLDVAERGVRLRTSGGVAVSGRVEGELRFPGGETAAIAGEVAWCAHGEAAVRLASPLPGRLLTEEQRRLRDHLKARR
ncbi:MAG: hypothetical protein AB1578_15335 [Thermodesulfobacteriota bacterium]